MDWQALLDQVDGVLNYRLITIGDTDVTLVSLILVVAILVVAAWVSRVVQRLAVRSLARRIDDDATVAATRRLVHYAIMAVAVGIGLDTIGFDLTALFAAGAFLAVAVGFAMQNILQNFVSGLILLIERSILPTHVLEVDGIVVRVEEMGIRRTIVRTWDEEDLIIPNSILVGGTVKNYTFRDSLYRLRTEVGVSYGSDVDQVRNVLQTTAASQPRRVEDRVPRVQLKAFGDSAILFDVSIWIDDPWEGRALRSDLNFAIWHALKEAGITIAFPQLDVHLDDLRQPRTGEKG